MLAGNVELTHQRLMTLENRTSMMAKAIMPALDDLKSRIANTNQRLTSQNRMMQMVHHRYSLLFRQTHEMLTIHHFALLLFKNYLTIQLGMLIHMIDEQDTQSFKSHDDYARNKRKFTQYLKYAEIWQSASVIYSYAVFLCDILLIVMFITFSIKYHKTRQAMLAAFISMYTSGIPQTKANPIGRTFPPLFTINLLEEDQIANDLEDTEGMQITIQAISFVVCVIVAMKHSLLLGNAWTQVLTGC